MKKEEKDTENLSEEVVQEETTEEVVQEETNKELVQKENISENEVEVKSKKKKSKKKLILFIFILILLIVLFLLWWFNRKFDVTFKYNNGEENYVVKVKYLNKIKDEDVKKDLTLANHTFIDYFETYYLDGKQIEKIKENPDSENTICKKNFKLNDDKNKCIAINPFNFKKQRITKDTTIEAFWSAIIFSINPTEKEIYIGDSFNISVTLSGTSDTSVKWSSDNEGIATVDDSGRVVGVKEGKTTINVESNGIKKTCDVTVLKKEEPKKEEPKKEETKKEEPKKEEPKKEEPKDEGTISLRANDQCMIGSDSVTITATVNNALDDTINWSSLKCFNINKESNNKVTISRIGRGTMCRGEEELNPTVTATLNNGNSDSLNFNYEFKLGVTVYDGDTVIQPRSDGRYYHEKRLKVLVNQDALITTTNSAYIVETGHNYVIVDKDADSEITITTNCGQSMTVSAIALIY